MEVEVEAEEKKREEQKSVNVKDAPCQGLGQQR